MESQREFQRRFRQSAGLYALFLLPTLMLLIYRGSADWRISRHITGTWQAEIWRFPGLGETASRVTMDILEWIVLGAIVWIFFRTLRLFRDQDIDFSAVLKWTAVCGLLLLAVVPFHSSDMYGYINRGVQQSFYHTNPYTTPIAYIPGWEENPLLHEHWTRNPSPYGFFFVQLAHGLAWLSGHRFVAAFLLFKALNLLMVLLCTGLVYRLARQLNFSNPGLSAYLIGANPLVLLHAIGNGHNDIMMVTLLMAALWALPQDRWRWLCLPLLALSILTKYASLLALPFMLVYMLKQRWWKATVAGTLISLLLAALLAMPYITPGEPWPWKAILDNAGRPQHSIIDMLSSMVYYPFKWLFQSGGKAEKAVLAVLKPLFWSGFVLFYGWVFWRFVRNPGKDFSGLLWAIGLTLTVMVALVSAKFHPWYPVMFLPVIVLLDERSKVRQFGILFSHFQLAGFTIVQNIRIINVILLTLLPLWLTFSKSKRIFR